VVELFLSIGPWIIACEGDLLSLAINSGTSLIE
jgi:hypothetical protein